MYGFSKEWIMFLVQDFVYSKYSRVTCEGVVIFHIFKLKKQLGVYEENIGLSEKELLKYHETPIFVLVGNTINKNKVVVV